MGVLPEAGTGLAKERKMNKSQKGWLLYIMVHLPFVFFMKVGITSLSIGAMARAKSIDRTMPGFPLPIFAVPIPGAYYVEQALHQMMKRFKVVFYKGNGRKEWFFMAPAFVALPIMVGVWFMYLMLLDRAIGTKIAPTLANYIFEVVYYFLS
jgi:hypothetical protein